MAELSRREVDLGLLALLAGTGLELPDEEAEAPPTETTQPTRREISYGELDRHYRKIKEIERRFARREETAKDIGDYYVCKFNIYVNRAFANNKDEGLAGKGSNALHAIQKYHLRGIVCT